MDYYISSADGKYKGPFKKENLIANGLKPETLVWRQGQASWLPARDMPEIADLLVATPPPLAMAMAQHASMTSPPPLSQLQNSKDALAQELEQSRLELEELKKSVITLENAKKKTKAPAGGNVTASSQLKSKPKSAGTNTGKAKTTTKAKKKPNNRYSYPVATWLNESITLMVIVVTHVLLAITGYTTFFYIYLDAVGAVLCATGITLGLNIQALNKISYKKDSPSRIKADKLSYINGLLVSVTAAIGFLIILVQSAHYIYVI